MVMNGEKKKILKGVVIVYLKIRIILGMSTVSMEHNDV
jgi:hypothetical protein